MCIQAITDSDAETSANSDRNVKVCSCVATFLFNLLDPVKIVINTVVYKR